MMVTVGSNDYPSFADVDFADEFLGGDVRRAALWAAVANDDAKGRGLVSATRMLVPLPWCVDPAPDPTAEVEDIPLTLQQVTAMLAADLLAKPKSFQQPSGNSNVKSAKAGSAQVEFFAPVPGGAPIPTALWDLLVGANLVGCLQSDDGIADVLVTGGKRCRPLGGRLEWDWPITEQDYD